MTTLSYRERSSKVWRVDNYIYKSQPKFLMDNEVWCMERMLKYGHVPEFERLNLELLRMDFIERESVTDMDLFVSNSVKFLRRLQIEGIRHGDLTMPHVFPTNNDVIVIDWEESRLWDEPRPSKREEGDAHWMKETVKQIIRE